MRKVAYFAVSLCLGLSLSICMPANADIFDWLSGVWGPTAGLEERIVPYPTAEQQELANVKVDPWVDPKQVIVDIIAKIAGQELRLMNLEKERKTMSKTSGEMSKLCLSFVGFLEEKKINKSATPKQFVSALHRLLYCFGKSPMEAREIHAQFPFIIADMLPKELVVEALDFFTVTLPKD